MRQLVLVETDVDVLFFGHDAHGNPLHTRAEQDPNQHAEAEEEPGHAAETPEEHVLFGQHDSLYLLTVNDQRFHHGLQAHEERTERVEQCTTDRWEVRQTGEPDRPGRERNAGQGNWRTEHEGDGEEEGE
jgi:hypothetical protein